MGICPADMRWMDTSGLLIADFGGYQDVLDKWESPHFTEHTSFSVLKEPSSKACRRPHPHRKLNTEDHEMLGNLEASDEIPRTP